MNNTVQAELENIYRGDKGSPQNTLRVYYNDVRRHDLAQKNPKGHNAILKDGIAFIKKNNPDFKPNYDKDFFSLK